MQKIILAGFISCIYSLFYQSLSAQNCDFSMSGKITCSDDGKSLPGVLIFISNEIATYSDDNGNFLLKGLCPQKYLLHVSLLGYSHVDTNIVAGDSRSLLQLQLHASEIHLDEVHIENKIIHNDEIQTLQKETVTKATINSMQGLPLGDMLATVPGLSALHSGTGVSKPIIHGLHSNRILILNNGVRQEGQQWGSEHAPEIDPFIATQISVIKGAASLRYGADAMGGAILIEPPPLPDHRCLFGEVNSTLESNGRAATISGILQGGFENKLKPLGWRVQGTIARSGYVSTPDYYLDNTASLQGNYSAAVGWKKKNYGLEIFYSNFYTEFGIFSGSHIGGDSTNLIAAFENGKPATLASFSYEINRGYQKVNHSLLKTSAWYQLQNGSKFKTTFARQYDLRQEFGFNVPFSSNGVDLSQLPEVYFQLITHSADLIWEHPVKNNFSGSMGLQFYTQGNVFKGLSYRSLIPNFRNYNGGIFVIEKYSKNSFTLEGGLRYDYKFQRQYELNSITLELEKPEQRFQNISGNIGASMRLNPHLSLQLNIGRAWRAPSIYELNVNGIHSSNSTYEVGNKNLETETALNSNASLLFENKKWNIETGFYANYIDNYIFLNPSLRYAVTYQGVFRVFEFAQTNALFKGVDVHVHYKLNNHWISELKADLIFANDVTKGKFLQLIPAQRMNLKIAYDFNDHALTNHSEIYLALQANAEQNRYESGSDFVPPPAGYKLLNAGISTSIGKQNNKITIRLEATNLLNTKYRDYLNFYRYFSDEKGRSFTLRINVPFGEKSHS